MKDFRKYFDHTLLKAFASVDDFTALCDEGIKYGVMALMVNPAAIAFCKQRLEGHDILLGAVVGFPLGQSTVETKTFETVDAIKKGADEIDYVLDVAAVKSFNYGYIRDEMEAITATCRERGVCTKVIFETCYLSDDEKKALCEIASAVKPDFIKTSTGFGTGGATLGDVKLMREYTDPAVKVKASGGISTLDDALKMVEAGAERLGTSRTVAIIEAYLNR
jgi:deoxyribose-phosphate aldolase